MASGHSLSREDISRYGRQLILPEWGVKGIPVHSSESLSESIVSELRLSCRSTCPPLYLCIDSGCWRSRLSFGYLPCCCRSWLVNSVVIIGCSHSLSVQFPTGVLGLLDYDAVEVSNLHRQILHHEEMLGTPKTDSAKKAISW